MHLQSWILYTLSVTMSLFCSVALAQDIAKAPSDDGIHEYMIRSGEVYHRIPGSRWGNEFWNINIDQNVKLTNAMQVSGHVGYQKGGLNVGGVRLGGEAGGLNLLILTCDGRLNHVFRHSSDGPKKGHWTQYVSVTDILKLTTTANILASGYVNEGPWPGFVVQERSGEKHVLSYDEAADSWHKDKFSMGDIGRAQIVRKKLYRYEYTLQALRFGGTVVREESFSCLATDDAIAEQLVSNKLLVWLQDEKLEYSTKRGNLKSKTETN